MVVTVALVLITLVFRRSNEYARNHGLRQFSVYQGRYSAAQRDMEREIIPMTQLEGMGVCLWGALRGSAFKTEQERADMRGRPMAKLEEKMMKVSEGLEKIAQRHNTVLTNVALAYSMSKHPYMFPVIGGRTRQQLEECMEGLSLKLSEQEIHEIEDIVPFELGFPADFYWGDRPPKHPADVWLLKIGGVTDNVPMPAPIEPYDGSD